MKYLLRLSSAFLIVSLSTATLASAAQSERPNREERIAQARAELGLTDEQVAEIEAIHEANRVEFESLREQMRNAETREERKAIAQELRLHSEATRSQVDTVLTDEQRAQVEAKRAERAERLKNSPRGQGRQTTREAREERRSSRQQ